METWLIESRESQVAIYRNINFVITMRSRIIYIVHWANLQSVFQDNGFTFKSYVFLLAPIEIGLSWIGSLPALAPFSIFADVCNFLAMGIVVKEDIEQAVRGNFSSEQRTAITSDIKKLPSAGGMAGFLL